MGTALSFLGSLGSPDNSQNWNSDDWGWWVNQDPASHPAGNFLIFLANNPSFIMKGVPGHDYNEIVRKLTNMGFGSQINQVMDYIYDDAPLGNVSVPKPPPSNSVGGAIQNFLGGTNNSYTDTTPVKSSNPIVWVVIGLAALLVGSKMLKK